MKVSICIPCYRSAKTLPIVVNDIQSVYEKQDDQVELVLVNDCSPDNTFEVIEELCSKNENIIGVDLSKNYGQASAKLAALQYATGDIIVFMDDDGQHPADAIPRLVSKVKEGYDVVYASFANKHHTKFKVITSNMHNRIAEWMGNKPKGIKRSSFSAWNRVVADQVRKYKSPFVSIGSFLMSVTRKYGNVEVEHKERIAGKSGYSFKKLFKLWLNIFISFSMVPLRIATFLGFLFSGVGFIGIIVLLIKKLLKPSIVSGYTSTLIIQMFMSGLIMIILGIMGEYLGRIYMTISGMPQYCIRQVINEKMGKDVQG